METQISNYRKEEQNLSKKWVAGTDYPSGLFLLLELRTSIGDILTRKQADGLGR